MSERPIEEVIGWERCLTNPGQWHRHPESYVDYPRAEVDDLAAWVARLGLRVVMASWIGIEDHPTPCHASIGPPSDDGRPDVYGNGDTIREALIAAVRKVVAS